MKTFKGKRAVVPAALAMAAALAIIAGCPAKETTVYVAPTYPGSFPGSPVSASNLASDGMAFSEPFVEASTPFILFTNHAKGTGIVLMKMEEDSGAATRYSLWASYFSGTGFTPNVEIRPEKYDPTDDFSWDSIRVVFLNTEGRTPAEGGERDGDAVIAFAWRETDTAGNPDRKLYTSYFDLSRSSEAVSSSDPTVRYGFSTVAKQINTSDDFDVRGIGVVTDGLYILSGKYSQAFDFQLNGSPVTFLGLVWNELENALILPEGRMYTAAFNLSDANTANVFSAPVLVTPSTTTDTDDQFSDNFIVTGDTVIYRVELKNGLYNHNVLEAARWNTTTGGLSNPAVLTRVDPDDTVDGQIPQDAYGSIQGLGRTYAVGYESGYDEDGTCGDTDLLLYVYDPQNGTADVREIDAYAGTSGGTWVVPSAVDVELSRTGEIIFIGWLQNYDDVNDTRCFFMQAVQTIPAGGSARTLTNAILASPARLNTDYTSDNATYADYADVVLFNLQTGAFFMFGNVSDALRMNTVFLQEPDQTGSDGDDLSLRSAYLRVTPDTTGVSPPTATSGESTVWTNDTDHPHWGTLNDEDFRCVDSGQGGDPVVYFLGDGDGNPQDETPGDPTETRLFVWDSRDAAPTAVEISGDGTDTGKQTLGFTNSRQVQAFHVTAVPLAPYTGAGSAENPATHHHVMMQEERDVPGSSVALRHRCFDLGSSATTVQQKFLPPLTDQPFAVDRDMPGDVLVFMGDGPSPVRGTTIAVYFKHGAHLWYNEYTPGGTWIEESGLPAPQIVDNVSPEEVIWWSYYNIAPFRMGDWDLISRQPVFYWKLVNLVGDQKIRVFVRVHN
jgi:hypothetical protein